MLTLFKKRMPTGAERRAKARGRMICRANGTTKRPRRQVSELLGHGRDAAISAADLAAMMDCGRRDVTRAIERERRSGHPICATSDDQRPGYFLPSSVEELDDYLGRLQRREMQIAKTRQGIAQARQITVDDLKDGGGNG